MDREEINKQIDAILSNVPSDVRRAWLYPTARNHGWPPSGRWWNAILLERDIGFWQHTTWSR